MRIAWTASTIAVQITLMHPNMGTPGGSLHPSKLHAIVYCFRQKYGACADRRLWKGRHGIATKIRKDLGIPIGTSMKSIYDIMEGVLQAKENGETYEVEYVSNRGQKAALCRKSIEAQIIADVMESGNSLRAAWAIVNTHRKAEALPLLTMSAVYSCIKRLQPLVEPVGKKKQGSMDAEAPGSKARFRWCLQLGMRFGLLDSSHIRNIINLPDCTPIPLEYNPLHLQPIKVDQFVTWDEVHRKCQPGSDNGQIISTVKKECYNRLKWKIQ